MIFEIGKSYLIEEFHHPPYIMKVEEIGDEGDFIAGPYRLVGDGEVARGLVPVNQIKKADFFVDVPDHTRDIRDQLITVENLFYGYLPEGEELMQKRLIEVKIILSDLITELEGDS